MQRKRGLGRALLMRFLLLSLLPIAIVGAAAYGLASHSLETRIREYLEEQAFQLAGSVERKLADASSDVATWARLSVFKGALIYDSYDKSEQYLRDFTETYPQYRALHLYNGAGTRVASSLPESGTSLRSDELTSVLSGKPSSSGIRRGEDGHRVVFAAPVMNQMDQTVSGAVVAELNWDEVLDSLDSAREHARNRGHKSTRILFIDPRGRIIGGEDRESILSASVPIDGVVSDALAGRRGSGFADFFGAELLLVGYAPLAGLGGEKMASGTCLVAEASSEALSPIAQLSWALIAIALCAIIAAYTLSRAVTRMVVRPVRAATKHAQAISRGELSGSIEVPARDELADLVQSLNSMSTELRHVAELADKVALGHLPEALRPRSEQDRLRHSLEDMTKYLNDMSQRAEQIAKGALAARDKAASPEDVLGRAFDVMVKNLHTLLVEVQSLANHTASASAEIAASAEQSARTGEQSTRSAERLMDILSQMSQTIGSIAGEDERDGSSSLEQMSGSIRSTAGNVDLLVLVAGEAAQSTASGRKAMDQASTGMGKIQSAIGTAAETVEALGARAENIGQIVGVIEDIAEQTNLLALNAAIEAARAGEHGAGFAVVADEVRKLAERSSMSASEIADLIRDIDGRVRSAVSVMTSSSGTVEEGIGRTIEVGKALESIDQVVGELNRLSKEIESATSIQADGAEKIAESARNLHQGTTEVMATTRAMQNVVHQNASSASQLAGSAQSLSGQVEQLHQHLSRFRLQ